MKVLEKLEKSRIKVLNKFAKDIGKIFSNQDKFKRMHIFHDENEYYGGHICIVFLDYKDKRYECRLSCSDFLGVINGTDLAQIIYNEVDDYLKDVDLVTLKFLFDKGGLDFNK